MRKIDLKLLALIAVLGSFSHWLVEQIYPSSHPHMAGLRIMNMICTLWVVWLMAEKED